MFTLHTISVQVLLKYFPGGVIGVDKEGSPVRVCLFGKADMQGLMRSATKSEFEKYQFWVCEVLLSRCRASSRQVRT